MTVIRWSFRPWYCLQCRSMIFVGEWSHQIAAHRAEVKHDARG